MERDIVTTLQREEGKGEWLYRLFVADECFVITADKGHHPAFPERREITLRSNTMNGYFRNEEEARVYLAKRLHTNLKMED
ncbi:MAG: hypothetical protein ACE5FT_03495 [Candidatus Nanoarchaeia archaeon]